jgi:hypothetical protein
MALGLTQPLTGMSTRDLPGGKGRPARKADSLTANYMGTSTSHNPVGPYALLQNKEDRLNAFSDWHTPNIVSFSVLGPEAGYPSSFPHFLQARLP